LFKVLSMFMAQLAQVIPVMGNVTFSLAMFAHFVRGIALNAERIALKA
jgi:hypothetical protein